jgi:hypothetical protein
MLVSNDQFGGDPLIKVPKELRVFYQNSGGKGFVTVAEGIHLTLP